MSERIPSSEERSLRERLRQEATESRPEFSESLHERIAGALRRHHAAIAAVPRAARAKDWQRGLVALAAAACLLAAVAIGWRLIQTGEQREPGRDLASDNQEWIERRQAIDQWTQQTATGLDGLLPSATPEPRESVLKHDARLVASTFLQPLPVNVPLDGQP
jgi:hypothetical protein